MPREIPNYATQKMSEEDKAKLKARQNAIYERGALPKLNAEQEKKLTGGTTYKGHGGNPEALAKAKANLMKLYPGGSESVRPHTEEGPSVSHAQLLEEAKKIQMQNPYMKNMSLEDIIRMYMPHRHGHGRFGKNSPENEVNQ